MVILVTGAAGQLGQAIKHQSKNHPSIDFVFCDSTQIDITDLKSVQKAFEQFRPNYCINAAAYTAVDKAETDYEKAHLINVIGAQNLAQTCLDFKTTLVHVSTDFVFDGATTIPYTESDVTHPMGVYGQTKLDGEKAIQNTFDNYFIIRTSWVYSQFGANFMKTMLRLATDRDSISVVNDQIGTPTNAIDLAEALLTICSTNEQKDETNSCYGVYNYSNEGQCSWYDFAKKIFETNAININLQPIPSTSFPTPAKRPAYSVLDKSKLKTVFGIEIKNWEESLKSTVYQ